MKTNSKHGQNRMSFLLAGMALRDDAVINAARFPNPEDAVMARYEDDVTGALPSDQELADKGFDRVELSRQIRAGMDVSLFTRAFYRGLNGDGFNHRDSENLEINTALQYLVDHHSDFGRIKPRSRPLQAIGI